MRLTASTTTGSTSLTRTSCPTTQKRPRWVLCRWNVFSLLDLSRTAWRWSSWRTTAETWRRQAGTTSIVRRNRSSRSVSTAFSEDLRSHEENVPFFHRQTKSDWWKPCHHFYCCCHAQINKGLRHKCVQVTILVEEAGQAIKKTRKWQFECKLLHSLRRSVNVWQGSILSPWTREHTCVTSDDADLKASDWDGRNHIAMTPVEIVWKALI